MRLDIRALANSADFKDAGIALPNYDVAEMRARTAARPQWVHFGAGNIFRAFILNVQQRLLNEGLCDRGITAVVSGSSGAMDQVYRPHDDLTLACTFNALGSVDMSVIASLGEAVLSTDAIRLAEIFRAPSLQICSLTITEKGYDWTQTGETPKSATSTIGQATALLLERYLAGAQPIAMLSLDNLTGNGDVLKSSITRVALAWHAAGLVPEGFTHYVSGGKQVSYPCSMIDKIVPQPSESVQAQLEEIGFTDMDIIVSARGTHLAPFVNAEQSEYLVIEDDFAGSRPPLEQAGALMANRADVDAAERMKVTACLNPVHTALAVYGCLLGYRLIADEMDDPELSALAVAVGREGMSTLEPGGILDPEVFFYELINVRLRNRALGDMPQRIASDTSKKLPIRYGCSITRCINNPDMDSSKLKALPLAIAGWLRYLNGKDDLMEPMPISPDPGAAGVRERFAADPVATLSDEAIFGCNLVAAGLAEKILAYYESLNAGAGAVRRTLKEFMEEYN